MADQIRVLVVDDIPETRDHLTKLLGFESDIDVVGAAASGREALEMAVRLSPDVVLMDINMPDMDGIAATEQLSAAVPGAAVVMMSVQGEADYLRRSMLAGAREFLVKPFSSDELTASIRQVSARERDKMSRLQVIPTSQASSNGTSGGTGEPGEPGLVVAVFSPKGGVGRTTVAVNLAVAAATELGKKVVVMDGSFQFGDVGVLLNLNPKSKSIADLVPELDAGEIDSIDTFVINHTSGVRVLLAPPSPEMAELITPAGVKKVLETLRRTHDLVVVDCTAFFNDTTLAILDAADVILTMLSLEITSIKNMRLFLEVAEQLGYEAGKVRLVLNRGVPFYLSNREAQVSQDILRLARSVVGERTATAAEDDRKATQKKSLFAWR
jgi:pilus assembly protein CpaE